MGSMTLLGAGVASASFTPLSLSPALWLKADAGLVTDGAAQFALASSQSLSRASFSAATLAGDRTFVFWAKNTGVANGYMIAKDDETDGREYTIQWDSLNFRAGAFAPGFQGVVSSVNTVANTWYFVAVTYTASSKVLAISVNAGTPDTVTLSNSPTVASAEFCLGKRSYAGFENYHDGCLDSVGIFTAVLSNAELTALYNSGAGQRYADLSTAQKINLASWYDFASPGSGLVADSHGTNTLTNNNGVSYAAGIVSGTASVDGDPVTTWQDQSGNGRHATAPTSAKRPTLKLAIKNGLPCVLWDAVDDRLDLPNFLSGFTQGEVFVVAKVAGYAASLWDMGSGHHDWWPYIEHTIYESWGTGTRKTTGVSLTAGNWYQYGVQSASGSFKMRLNGSEVFSTGTNTVGFTTSPILGYNGGTGATINSYIAELLIFDTVLSSPNRALVETYLNNRWSVY